MLQVWLNSQVEWPRGAGLGEGAAAWVLAAEGRAEPASQRKDYKGEG